MHAKSANNYDQLKAGSHSPPPPGREGVWVGRGGTQVDTHTQAKNNTSSLHGL